MKKIKLKKEVVARISNNAMKKLKGGVATSTRGGPYQCDQG